MERSAFDHLGFSRLHGGNGPGSIQTEGACEARIDGGVHDDGILHEGRGSLTARVVDFQDQGKPRVVDEEGAGELGRGVLVGDGAFRNEEGALRGSWVNGVEPEASVYRGVLCESSGTGGEQSEGQESNEGARHGHRIASAAWSRER
jgi:hypothetical protein